MHRECSCVSLHHDPCKECCHCHTEHRKCHNGGSRKVIIFTEISATRRTLSKALALVCRFISTGRGLEISTTKTFGLLAGVLTNVLGRDISRKGSLGISNTRIGRCHRNQQQDQHHISPNRAVAHHDDTGSRSEDERYTM